MVSDKKAVDVIILDLRRLVDFTDYFLICSGESFVQVRAIADAVQEALEKENIDIWHVEGYRDAHWILVDCGDVVVHIFYRDTRELYSLERIWGDAKQIKFED